MTGGVHQPLRGLPEQESRRIWDTPPSSRLKSYIEASSFVRRVAARLRPVQHSSACGALARFRHMARLRRLGAPSTVLIRSGSTESAVMAT